MSKIFPEDTVYRITKDGNIKFGLVTGTSNPVSDESDSDFEAPEVTPEGFVKVVWHSPEKEQMIAKEKIQVADRKILVGDVVKHADPAQGKQLGICKKADLFASVSIMGTNQVIYGVDAKEFKHIEQFYPDTLVTLDSWAGLVTDISCAYILKLAEGSVCVLEDKFAEELEEINDEYQRDETSGFQHYFFYPGMKLQGSLSSYKKGEFLHESQKMKKLKNEPGKKTKSKSFRSTIIDVKLLRVKVDWQMKGLPVKTDSNQRPSRVIKGTDLERLKKVSLVDGGFTQLGDRFFYQLKEDDVLMEKTDWAQLEIRTKNDGFISPQTTAVKTTKRSAKARKSKGKKKKVPFLGQVDGACCSGYAPRDTVEPTTAKDVLNTQEETDSKADESGADDESDGESSTLSDQLADRTRKRRGLKRSSFLSAKRKRKQVRKSGGGASGSQTDSEASEKIDFHPGDLVPVEIVSTYSEVTVLWQDGTIETGIKSTSLVDVDIQDEKQFLPEEIVEPDNPNANPDLNVPHCYGVVQRVSHEDRICTVKWFGVRSDSSSPTCITETEEPVFDIKPHEDFNASSASAVIRVENFFNETDLKQDFVVGEVLGMDSCGQLKVSWPDRTTGLCWPQDLFKIGDFDEGGLVFDLDEHIDGLDYFSYPPGGTESDSDDDWITDSEGDDDESLYEPSTDIDYTHVLFNLDIIETGVVYYKHQVEELGLKDCKKVNDIVFGMLNLINGGFTIDDIIGTNYFGLSTFRDPVKAFYASISGVPLHEEVSKALVSWFGEKCFAKDKTGNPVERECPLKHEGFKELLDLVLAQTKLVVAEIRKKYNIEEEASVTSDNEPSEQVIEAEPEKEAEKDSSDAASKEDGASGFSVIPESPRCHKFLNTGDPLMPAAAIAKAARKEMQVLQSSLPEGIAVLAFENRIDLYSAMITGPANTPYEDALFFFDVKLPHTYPNSPPLCHYWSFCSDRLNPNLYQEGKVCVSLLGTWSGKGSQNWNPKSSNLLQLFVSIQGLILNDEPFYNEPGFDKQRGTEEGDNSSRSYNEMALLKVVQSMTNVIKNPPLLFEDRVKEHFKAKGKQFVTRLESFLASDTEKKPGFKLLPVSKGFKIGFAKALDAFKSALMAAGIPIV